VAVTAVLAAGCSFASGMLRTTTALREAGIDNPDIAGGNGRVTVTYDAHASGPDLPAEQDRVAGVIWRNLPFRFSELAVTPRGASPPPSAGTRTYTREELEARLGPRPSGLDNTARDIEASARTTVRNVIIGLIVGGIVLLALVTLIIVLVVRASRRARPPVPAPAVGGWGPAPPGGQGWGQPQAPGWGQPPPPGPGRQQAPGWGQQRPEPPEQGPPPER